MGSIEGSSVRLEIGGPGSRVQVELRSRGWRSPKGNPKRLPGDDRRIAFRWSIPPVEVVETFTVGDGCLERRVEVVNPSRRELQLTGVRLHLPGVTLGAADECRVDAPATSLRPRLPLAAFLSRRLDDAWDDSLAPGAKELWGWGVADAPDVTPGLLSLRHDRANLTFLTWYHSQVEAATPQIFGQGRRLTLGHQLGLAGWLAPGERLGGGTQYLALVHGSWEEALTSFRNHYSRVGLVPPPFGSPPAWVRPAVVYEVHPGPLGGFRGLEQDLPRLKDLGVNVVYLLPVMEYHNRSGRPWDENWLGSGSPYAMKDFEAFDPTLGGEDDFRALVRAAHRLGMRVLMDFVPQGCALDARYVTEHPEWFCRDEQGHLVSSHGWTDTYSFDWANPEFQAYMLSWSVRFAREFDLDGYRIDAPHAKEPNWDRSIPYHASRTSLGVLPLLERLRLALHDLDPDKAMLCELFGPVYARSHDFQYDYHPFAHLHALLRGEVSAAEVGQWFEDYWAVMPPGAMRLSFTETHDTRTQSRAYAWRGSAGERSIFAILMLAGFIPMLWAGQERGLEEFYRQVLSARAHSPALLTGERRFNAVGCSLPDVVSILCRTPEEIVWGIVSLHAERTPMTFSLPVDLGLQPGKGYHLIDLARRRRWSESDVDSWPGDVFRSLTLSPIPFEPLLLRIQAAHPSAESR